jgi:hypothetical protein
LEQHPLTAEKGTLCYLQKVRGLPNLEMAPLVLGWQVDKALIPRNTPKLSFSLELANMGVMG